MSIDVKKFDFLSASDLTTVVAPATREMVQNGLHHLSDLTHRPRSFTTTADGALAARRRLALARPAASTRLLLPGYEPQSVDSKVDSPPALEARLHSHNPKLNDGPPAPFVNQELDHDVGYHHIAIHDGVGGASPFLEHSPTTQRLLQRASQPVPQPVMKALSIPSPPAPYSPRIDPRVQRSVAASGRFQRHQKPTPERLLAVALRKRLSVAGNTPATVVSEQRRGDISVRSTEGCVGGTGPPTNGSQSILGLLDRRALALEDTGVEALDTVSSSSLPAIQQWKAIPNTTVCSRVAKEGAAAQGTGQQPLPPLSRSGGGSSSAQSQHASSPANGAAKAGASSVLHEREDQYAKDVREVCAVAARAAAQMGLVEALPSLSIPAVVLPDRCSYTSLHPLGLIREVRVWDAPDEVGGGACARLGWEMFLASTCNAPATTATSPSNRSTRRPQPPPTNNPTRISSDIKAQQQEDFNGPRPPNKVVARAPTARSTVPQLKPSPPTAPPAAGSDGTTQLWSWGQLEALAQARTEALARARARAIPNKSTSLSEELTLRRAQMDREAFQLTKGEAQGRVLNDVDRRRRTTILASRNPLVVPTKAGDGDTVGRGGDEANWNTRVQAIANLALYEADPDLFSVLGEDTCLAEYPTFPFVSERETAAYRVLENAGLNRPKAGDGKDVKRPPELTKAEEAEEEKKRLERAVMARFLHTNREAFDQQDRPSDDWKTWKRSAGAVASASAIPVVPKLRAQRRPGGVKSTTADPQESLNVLAASEVINKVNLEDRLTILWQLSYKPRRDMHEFAEAQKRAGRDTAKDAEEEVKPHPTNVYL